MDYSRKNLVVDAHVLREAQVAYGKETMSETVNFALEELMRRFRARNILYFGGQGKWEGDLGEMRRDRPRRRRRK